jgi:hypothetical protein
MRVLSFFIALALGHAFQAPIVQRVPRGGATGMRPLQAAAKERTYIMVRSSNATTA